MLTGFKTIQQNQKREDIHQVAPAAAKSTQARMLELLKEAVTEGIHYNSFKVYIDGYSFSADIKFPEGITLGSLNTLLLNNKLEPLENKTLDGGEIIFHSFKILPGLTQILEVLYRPISRPRM